MQTNAWSWSYLLALRHAAGPQLHDLAVWLLNNTFSPGATAPWPITPDTWLHAQRQADALVQLRIALVPVWRLPLRLLTLKPMPPALFVRGNTALLAHPGVGVVGSRQASADAVRWASDFAAARARAGMLVISGGAVGIDAAAHRGALRVHAPTLAYVGSCVDDPYPRGNRALFADIVNNGGALVSEHPPMGQTFKADHAKRNRFIAAHASELTVVEAAAASGTLTTAMWARRAGTPIFVSPAGVGQQRAGLTDLLSHGWAHEHVH